VHRRVFPVTDSISCWNFRWISEFLDKYIIIQANVVATVSDPAKYKSPIVESKFVTKQVGGSLNASAK